MKLTRNILKEFIREEIQKLNEGLLWEQGLDESWFSDMKAKAQQAYIKANPGSKYAKGVKSGDKEAPMTGKEKGAHDKETAKKEKEQEQERIKSSNRKHMAKSLKGGADFPLSDLVHGDPEKRKEAIKDFDNQLAFGIYPDNEMDGGKAMGIASPMLFDELMSHGKATPKVMKLISKIGNDDGYEGEITYEELYKELQGIKRGGLIGGGSYAGILEEPPEAKKEREKRQAKKAKEKKADAPKTKEKDKEKSSSKSSDFANTFRKIGTGSAI